ncbi:hypothetical protein HMPREF9946_01982 [Acetobacteraceae bacterium AT-5844]|nr:hypothetical protein HMPREF9946_01982 [Acetobacteraceae bacterium AT-5844]
MDQAAGRLKAARRPGKEFPGPLLSFFEKEACLRRLEAASDGAAF